MGRDTKPELRLRRLLFRHGYRYRVNAVVDVGDVRVRADVIFTRQRLAVFVDGCYWHGCPLHCRMPKDPGGYWRAKIEGNSRRDKFVRGVLASRGWRVIQVWEHEDVNAAAQAVEQALEEIRADNLG